MSECIRYHPTVEQLEEQLAYLQDQVLTTRMHLRVARKAAKRREEGHGWLLPGMNDVDPAQDGAAGGG